MKEKLDIEDGLRNPLESGNRRCQFPTVLSHSPGWVGGWHRLPPKCPKISAMFKELLIWNFFIMSFSHIFVLTPRIFPGKLYKKEKTHE
jgi:hypothetical protein